jgi:prepilin-type N-terminal cleavage/methylation domain-containing protein
MRARSQGFTLIELLVVVSIIGLISSVIITSINSARVKGRDTERIAQVNQFMQALEVYYSAHGKYPCADVDCALIQVRPFTSSSNVGQSLVSAGVISEIPADPLHSSAPSPTECNLPGYGYCYCSNGVNGYVITINTEDDKGDSDRCFIDHGPGAAGFCQGHHGTPGDIAGQECSARF